MLKFLQGSSNADNLVQVAMNPDKYGKCLQNNAKQLIEMMGSYVTNKSAILNILSKNIPAKYAADIFSTPEGTIKAAKRMTEEELQKTLIFFKQNSGKRCNITYRELQQFQEFLRLKCPTPSGSKSDKFMMTIPIQELYIEFQKWRKNGIELEDDLVVEEIQNELKRS
jgi:hypothetical protein